MIWYKLFFERLEKMKSKTKTDILKKIFGLDILLYTLVEFDEGFVFKCYDGYTYYQFNFILDSTDRENYFNINTTSRIVLCDIYVKNFGQKIEMEVIKNDNFYKFLKFLRDGDINYLCSFLEDDF